MFSILKRNRLFVLGGILLSVLLAAITGYIEFIRSTDRTQEALNQEIGRMQDRLSIIDANMHAVVALISSGNIFQPSETARFLTLLRSPVSGSPALVVKALTSQRTPKNSLTSRPSPSQTLP